MPPHSTSDALGAALARHDDEALAECIARGEHVGWRYLGMNALMYAAYLGNAGAITALAAAGVDPNERYARDPSMGKGSFEAAGRHDRFTALHFAIFYLRKEAVRRLIEVGADLTCESATGWTPRTLARYRSPAIAEILDQAEQKERSVE